MVSIWIRFLVALACVFAASAEDVNFENKCTAFTFNQCTLYEEDIKFTVPGLSDVECQDVCNVVDDCYFFMHRRTGGTCVLVQQPLQQYLDSCKQIGGPKTPTVTDCNDSSDPCKVSTLLYKNKSQFQITRFGEMIVYIIPYCIHVFFRHSSNSFVCSTAIFFSSWKTNRLRIVVRMSVCPLTSANISCSRANQNVATLLTLLNELVTS